MDLIDVLTSSELKEMIRRLRAKNHPATELRTRLIQAYTRILNEKLANEAVVEDGYRLRNMDEDGWEWSDEAPVEEVIVYEGAGGVKRRKSHPNTRKSCVKRHMKWVPSCWSHKGYCRVSKNKK